MIELNKIHNIDCLEGLKQIPDNTFDSVVTDPPYGLSFMGKKWDYDVPKVEIWKECLRVLKPGGHALVACGTRTQHRMAVNLEDAGFQIRDIVAWVYGSGFPKSLNVGKAIDKLQGNEREVIGKKVRGDVEQAKTKGSTFTRADANKNNKDIFGYGVETLTKGTSPYEGWGTALKPAMELWTLCRKPLSEKTVAQNVLKHNTGGINIDGCRIGDEEIFTQGGKKGGIAYGDWKEAVNKWHTGRFPSNLIHDGSDEVVSLFPDSKGAGGSLPDVKVTGFGEFGEGESQYTPNNRTKFNSGEGSASRFFYCAKASKSERNLGLGSLGFNSLEIVLYNSDNSNPIWNEKITIQEENKAKHLEDMDISLKKVIGECGIKLKEDLDLNITSFGKLILEKYLKDTKCTTLMEIKSTTTQQILDLLQHCIIKESTRVAFSKMMDGGNLVVNVENYNTLTVIIKGNQGLALGVKPVVLKMQFRINEKESSNFHSTVKPVSLMRYLCRLITPTKGLVLDPFTGSGSTCIGAKFEDFNYLGFEMEDEYCKIAESRLDLNYYIDEETDKPVILDKTQKDLFSFTEEQEDKQ